MKKIRLFFTKLLFGEQPFKDEHQIHAELMEKKDAILLWIYSCEKVDQLNLCEQVIWKIIVERFLEVSHPVVFQTVIRELEQALKFKTKALSYTEAKSKYWNDPLNLRRTKNLVDGYS